LAVVAEEANWSITENNGSPCFWADAKTPPAGPCPGGTIQALGSEGILSPSVIYFAPNTAGTYHITGSQAISYTKDVSGMADITVGS
jgi:hypothetical protein